ncbi:MAG: ammonia-forming cytochrome c nitrite reductase subunit c552 [Coriobacteriia bacterium]|nr:ammonia-forming cytochrome c nitrite reductase subunit c552 [Coriobacteriia bacterium]
MNKRNKWLVIIAVVVIVLAAAVVAGLKWHEQPSFCSTLCHKPMAPYYETWKSGDMLAAVHGKADVACLDCHESTISQQASEAFKYVTGNYQTPLPFVKLGTKEFCLRCHGSYEELGKTTADYDDGSGRNPHDSHNGELGCYSCHRVHEQSQLFCSPCHASMEVPSGWKAAGK